MKYNHTWLAGHYRRINALEPALGPAALGLALGHLFADNALPAMYDSILIITHTSQHNWSGLFAA